MRRWRRFSYSLTKHTDSWMDGWKGWKGWKDGCRAETPARVRWWLAAHSLTCALPAYSVNHTYIPETGRRKEGAGGGGERLDGECPLRYCCCVAARRKVGCVCVGVHLCMLIMHKAYMNITTMCYRVKPRLPACLPTSPKEFLFAKGQRSLPYVFYCFLSCLSVCVSIHPSSGCFLPLCAWLR